MKGFGLNKISMSSRSFYIDVKEERNSEGMKYKLCCEVIYRQLMGEYKSMPLQYKIQPFIRLWQISEFLLDSYENNFSYIQWKIK